MLEWPALRFFAIIFGTVLWDAAAVLQKKAVGRLPSSALKLAALFTSPLWMGGLLVSFAGWGLYVFGLDRVPVSAARTITGGSYVVLALFSMAFLRTPLRVQEWTAVALVTAGIVILGLVEPTSPGVSLKSAVTTGKMLVGLGAIGLASVCLYVVHRAFGKWPRPLLTPLMVFAAISGLLTAVGDLMVKILLSFTRAPAGQPPGLPVIAACAAGLIAFYLAGFYMLSRAYQVGTAVGAMVISDFSTRVGAIFLGAIVLSEALGTGGTTGALRGLGFLLVLGGSLLLGRFGALTPRTEAV
jgi:multidrug transporter EmrE-like cation transporter